MKCTGPRLFAFVGVILSLTVITLLGGLIAFSWNQIDPAVTPNLASSLTASNIFSTMTPESSSSSSDNHADQNIFLSLLISACIVGILYLIRKLHITSREVMALSGKMREVEKKQDSSLQIGKTLQRTNRDLIKGVSLISQGKSEKNPSETVDINYQTLNDNIAALRTELSEFKQENTVKQSSALPEELIGQLREAINRLFKEHPRLDVPPAIRDEVLRSQIRVGIYEHELNKMKELVSEYPDLETGGDLFGFWTHSGAPVIHYILGPGPNCQHFSTSFYQDEDFLRTNGEYLNQKHGLQHIGEWHSHHRMSLDHPSGGDEDTVRSALANYGFQRFLLCIATIDHKGNVSVKPYLFEANNSTYKLGKWNIFSEKSPFSNIENELPANKIQIKKSFQTQKMGSSAGHTDSRLPFPQAWYTTDDGRSFLKELHSLIMTSFDECEMKLTKSGQLYFSVKNSKLHARLHFPNDFPKSQPSVSIGEKIYNLPSKASDKPNKRSQWIHKQFVEIIEEVEDELYSKKQDEN
jgi:hypothetical protein